MVYNYYFEIFSAFLYFVNMSDFLLFCVCVNCKSIEVNSIRYALEIWWHGGPMDVDIRSRFGRWMRQQLVRMERRMQLRLFVLVAGIGCLELLAVVLLAVVHLRMVASTGEDGIHQRLRRRSKRKRKMRRISEIAKRTIQIQLSRFKSKTLYGSYIAHISISLHSFLQHFKTRIFLTKTRIHKQNLRMTNETHHFGWGICVDCSEYLLTDARKASEWFRETARCLLYIKEFADSVQESRWRCRQRC